MAMFTNQTRFTGMSGLEVNDMVSQLMRAHSVRLNRMRQQRELIVWQRDALRNVATDLRTFRSNFLDFGQHASQNIRSVSNFQAINTEIRSRIANQSTRGVGVTALDLNDTRARRLEIHSAAQGDSFRSLNSLNKPIVADSGLNLNNLRGVGGFSMRVELNGRTETISIHESDIPGGAGMDALSSFVSLVNERLRDAFGVDSGGNPNQNLGTPAQGAHERQHVWATLTGTNFTINARAGSAVSISDNNMGHFGGRLEGVGFARNTVERPDGTRISPSTVLRPDETSITSFLPSLGGSFSFVINNTTFAFSGTSLTVNGTTVMDVVERENLTLQHVMNAVNNSNAGVRMSFSQASGRITMESREVGAVAGRISFNDNWGGFFEAIGFGPRHDAQAIASMQGGTPGFSLTSQPLRAENAFNINNIGAWRMNGAATSLAGVRIIADSPIDFNANPSLTASIDVSFGGVSHTINIAPPPPPNDTWGTTVPPLTPEQHFLWVLNFHLSSTFGIVGGNGNVRAEFDADGRLFFSSPTGGEISIDNAGPDLGFNAAFLPRDNAINPNTRISDLMPGVTGNALNFTIAGVTFGPNVNNTSLQFDHTMTVQQVMDIINAADIIPGIGFDPVTERFSIQTPNTHTSLSGWAVTGGFFNAIGLGVGQRMYDAATVSISVIHHYNGNDNAQTITIPEPPGGWADYAAHGYASREEYFVSVLNGLLQAQFGGDVRARFENNRIVFDSPTGGSLLIGGGGINFASLSNLGFNAPQVRSNAFNPETTRISDIIVPFPGGGTSFTIGEEVFNITNPNMTVQQVINMVNNNANIGVRMNFIPNTQDPTLGRFVLETTDPNISLNDLVISGDFIDAVGLGAAQRTYQPTARHQLAADAVVYVDGTRFVRASNSFDIDGIRITLDPRQLDLWDPETNTPRILDLDVTFERDTESVMQLIRDFVEGYNELIRSIRELTETRRPRQTDGRGLFMPLTDEQRREMSEREIELWEEQARTGILHRDDTLRRLTQDLHRSIFQEVRLSGGGTIRLVDIGIRTHSDLNRFGELQIDEDRLRAWVEERSEDVTELFTNFSDIPAGTEPNPDRQRRLDGSGIGQRINDILTWQLSYGGGLYTRVGAASHGDRPTLNNVMDRRLEAEDLRIDNQLRILQRRETRYFQIFSRLEAAMIQANSQMMFMEQMFWMA